MKKILENDLIIVYDNMHDYDFKYAIKNKHDKKLNIYLNGLDDYLEIEGNNWVGLFYGDYSNDIIKSLKNKDYDYNFIYEVLK